MKYVFVLLMCGVPLGVAGLLARQPVAVRVPQTRAERAAELRELKEQGQVAEERILLLEAEEHNCLPR